MKENKLADLSMNFSIQMIELVNVLKSKHETIIANQIGRSGTSIGANIYEAKYAQGKKDFISELEIALKEASETGYWLELLHRTNYIDDAVFHSLSGLFCSRCCLRQLRNFPQRNQHKKIGALHSDLSYSATK